MDPAVLSALSAILGSTVGASATIATAWLTQRTQGRRASIEAEVRKREALYGEFISEGSKLLIDSLDHQLDHPDRLYALYAVLNRIRLVSSDEVLAVADLTATRIIERYYRPNLSAEEMRQLVLSRADDPLKEFGDVCRVELQRFQRGA
jgi:hypothetical protein